MAKNHNTGGKTCTCSKCGATANSIPNTTHRRCPGLENQALRTHGNYIPAAERGQWK